MKKILIMIAALTLTGCATINNGGTQDFTIKTTNDKNFRTTICRLNNEEGKWQATPASIVTIHRDGNDLNISCENEQQTGLFSVPPTFNVGSMIADIIFLCTGCLVIDAATNAFYEYPEKVEIPMIDKDKTLAPEKK